MHELISGLLFSPYRSLRIHLIYTYPNLLSLSAREPERDDGEEGRANGPRRSRRRPAEGEQSNARQTVDTVLLRLRNSVMSRGYFLTSLVWPMTTTFRDLDGGEHATTFEYMAWCRDHLIAFARFEIISRSDSDEFKIRKIEEAKE